LFKTPLYFVTVLNSDGVSRKALWLFVWNAIHAIHAIDFYC